MDAYMVGSMLYLKIGMFINCLSNVYRSIYLKTLLVGLPVGSFLTLASHTLLSSNVSEPCWPDATNTTG